MYQEIVITLLTTIAVDANFCSETITNGPYHLEPNSPIPVKIEKNKITLTKTTLTENEVHGIFAYRSVWKSYCFQGGPMDGNTGCIEGLTDVKPSLEEAMRWLKTEGCYTGNDVIDGWGSDSSQCISPQEMTVKHSHKELIRRSTNNRFWYHICNISWRCGFHTISLPATLEQGHIMVPLSNGSLTNATTGKFYETGDSIAYITNMPTVKTYDLTVDCIINKETRTYYCVDPETRLHFEITEMKMTCEKSACYFIKTGTLNTRPKDFLEPEYWNSASIRDISRVVVYLQEMEYINQMNAIRLQNHMYSMETKIIKLVESLAKIDDRLIGHMLEQPMQTQFLSESKFLVSPCITKQTNTNCVGNQIFKDGRWVANQNPADCIKLSKSQNITLFSNFTLWLPNLDSIDFQGIARDLTGWSYFANAKAALDDTMRYTRQGGPHSSLQDLVDWPKGALNSLTHSFGLSIFGSYVFCILIGIAVWFVIKRF